MTTQGDPKKDFKENAETSTGASKTNDAKDNSYDVSHSEASENDSSKSDDFDVNADEISN